PDRARGEAAADVDGEVVAGLDDGGIRRRDRRDAHDGRRVRLSARQCNRNNDKQEHDSRQTTPTHGPRPLVRYVSCSSPHQDRETATAAAMGRTTLTCLSGYLREAAARLRAAGFFSAAAAAFGFVFAAATDARSASIRSTTGATSSGSGATISWPAAFASSSS